ncbi:MAG: tail fiber domain-containing protein [Flavobacteriia bacterium]|nr:tail fiber domain-containing protein [Flavobacteriia bacterium]
MKTLQVLFFVLAFHFVEAQNQNVGIGTISPDASAALDIVSTNKGLLIPRMDSTSRKAISDPAEGLMVYDSTYSSFYYYSNSSWQAIGSAATSDEVFEISNGVVRPTSNVAIDADNFVFGSTQLDDDGVSEHDQRFFFAKSEAAFRAGTATDASWDSDSLGYGSVAFGNGARATGTFSFATGNSRATSYMAVGMGDDNIASGVGSVAMGQSSQASETGSVAIGNGAIASGPSSVSMGASTIASSYASTALGENTEASNAGATAMGSGTEASGTYSTAMGTNSSASGYASTSMGDHGEASNVASTAMGYFTTASGNISTAMGDNTIASGDASTAMGSVTTASSRASTAMGSSTVASGYNSTAMGQGTRARSHGEVAMGSYNTNYNQQDSTAFEAQDRLLVVGNGTSDEARSDALVILKNGNTGLGTSNPDTTLHLIGQLKYEDGNQSDGYVLTSDSLGNASWQATSSSSAAVFDTLGGVVIPGSTVDIANDDFVFGSTQLNNDDNTDHTSRMFFDKSKGAFRAGSVNDDSWDDENRGNYSIGLGRNTLASGFGSVAIGEYSIASGQYSFALGDGAEAEASGALALGGGQPVAEGLNSLAIGPSSWSSSESSVAIGNGAFTLGTNSISIGNVRAQSFGEVAIGGYNTLYTPVSTDSVNIADRAFVIGAGTSPLERKDALVVLKNGNSGIGTSTPDTTLHLVGQFKYDDGNQAEGYILTSDSLGNASWAATQYTAEVFSVSGNVVQPGSAINESVDDFVFGSPQLDSDGESDHYNRFFFDKSLGAFRSGYGFNENWNEDSIGAQSVAIGYAPKASGIGAVAFGHLTQATGYNAVAMGENSQALNTHTTALGYTTVASGNASTALGAFTTASAQSATATGLGTIASGKYSTAMGNSTTASANNSISMGIGTQAHSYAEMVTGSYNTNYNQQDSTAFAAQDRLLVVGNGTADEARSDALVILKSGNTGLGTSTPDTTLHIVGQIKYEDGSQADGYVLTSDANGNASWEVASSAVFDTLGGVVVPGNVTDAAIDDFVFGSSQLDYNNNTDYASRFFFDKGKGAFRAGTDSLGTWNNDSLGQSSFAAGLRSLAMGFASTALGRETQASASSSTAMGSYTLASGSYSTAMGLRTEASGSVSTAMGSRTEASGSSSTAMGSETEASGNSSVAMGINTTASGDYSVSAGQLTTASGNNAAALGYSTTASGLSSTALGNSTLASSFYATAMGNATNASGSASTAMGDNTSASGLASVSMGKETVARSAYEISVGSYNTDYSPNSASSWNRDDRLFNVGNGTSDANRSEALVILKSGNTGLGTSTPDTTLHVVGQIKYNDGNQADGYVLTSDANGNASWVAPSADTDDQTLSLSGTDLTLEDGNTIDITLPIIADTDNDTKIQVEESSDEDLIRFEVGGVEAMVIDNNGRVGIGISDPSVELDLETDSSLITSRVYNGSGSGTARSYVGANGGGHINLIANATSSDVYGIPAGYPGIATQYKDMVFATGTSGNNSTEKMRLTATGDLGVGTDNPSYTLQVGEFGDGTQARANAWNLNSDRRWKKELVVIPGALNKLDSVNGYFYYWKEGADTSQQLGIIAQEIEEILPQCVSTDENGYKSVDYGKLTAWLIQVNKEQQETIQQLQESNQSLSAQLNSEKAELEARLARIESLLATELTAE